MKFKEWLEQKFGTDNTLSIYQIGVMEQAFQAGYKAGFDESKLDSISRDWNENRDRHALENKWNETVSFNKNILDEIIQSMTENNIPYLLLDTGALIRRDEELQLEFLK